MIAARGLTKQYGAVQVLRGLDLTIARGRVTAIIGPNGAGKTTFIKSLLGLTRPDAGILTFDGFAIGDDERYRARIGYMPQIARFPDNLTGTEFLTLLRTIRGSTSKGGGRALLAFDANVVVGTAGGSRHDAPVIGNIAEDRSRSKGAYAAQLTLIATFVVLCYVMLTFSSDSDYVLPIIYSLLVVFYDTRPDLARAIFPKLWR